MKKKAILSMTLVMGLFSSTLFAQKEQVAAAVDVSSSSLSENGAMAQEVKQAFIHSWEGYKQYAWGMDALKPLTKTGHNWYTKSLLMTPVDAYDVMKIMGLKQEAAEAKKLIIDSLNFNVDMEVQNFEVSIRILGGLLSAYELDGDLYFLKLAEDLGDRLIKAFDSPTGMPYRYVNLKTGKTRGEISNPAEIGTYVIEYGILSRHTGNPRYYEIAKKAMISLHSFRSELNLTGSSINVETGEWKSTSSHISGGIDSYLEYMLKAGILFNDKEMIDMWNVSLEAVNKYLADYKDNGLWYGHADMKDGKITGNYYGSLDAFFAGSLAMAGELDKAKALQNSNFLMWKLHEIEPEGLNYATMEITWPNYSLRPENIEGAYYLYQYTKDPEYMNMGAFMFNSLVKYCKNETGFCALKSVVTKEKEDYMESFFLAETLKYAFLLFDDNQSLDFKSVIFNTEAHPYKR